MFRTRGRKVWETVSLVSLCHGSSGQGDIGWGLEIKTADVFLVLCSLHSTFTFTRFSQAPSRVVEDYCYCVLVCSFRRWVTLGCWASKCWTQNSNLGFLPMDPAVLPRPHSFLSRVFSPGFPAAGEGDACCLWLLACSNWLCLVLIDVRGLNCRR